MPAQWSCSLFCDVSIIIIYMEMAYSATCTCCASSISRISFSKRDGASDILPVYRKIIRYLESNYMQPVSLDELAGLFHVSKYYLSREFHRCTGYVPGEYLIRLRLQHAYILPAQSELSIEEVAALAGFGNMLIVQ